MQITMRFANHENGSAQTTTVHYGEENDREIILIAEETVVAGFNSPVDDNATLVVTRATILHCFNW